MFFLFFLIVNDRQMEEIPASWDVRSLSHYLPSFIHPRWLTGFLPSTVLSEVAVWVIAINGWPFLAPVAWPQVYIQVLKAGWPFWGQKRNMKACENYLIYIHIYPNRLFPLSLFIFIYSFFFRYRWKQVVGINFRFLSFSWRPQCDLDDCITLEGYGYGPTSGFPPPDGCDGKLFPGTRGGLGCDWFIHRVGRVAVEKLHVFLEMLDDFHIVIWCNWQIFATAPYLCCVCSVLPGLIQRKENSDRRFQFDILRIKVWRNIPWLVPPTKSHHQDYYVFRGSQPKPSFATGRGDKPKHTLQAASYPESPEPPPRY